MRIRALLIAFLIVAGSVLTAVEANAAGTVYIYKVYFDSPGSDRGSNSSLNAEYVVIKNGDHVSHSVSGWTVRDKAGHRYTFPDGFRLGAGKQAVIHTGDGSSYTTSASRHMYWGREWYVGSTNFSGVGPVHAADFCGRVTAMWLRIRRW
jgi:hypothetical protein